MIKTFVTLRLVFVTSCHFGRNGPFTETAVTLVRKAQKLRIAGNTTLHSDETLADTAPVGKR